MYYVVVFHFLFWILLISAYCGTEKRSVFFVPLAILSTTLNSDGSIDEVFIKFEDSDEGWAISPKNDRYVKDNRKLRMDHIYRETESQAWLLSNFEASLISKVCESFIETLKILEKNIRDSRRDRCLYLDYWMPVFIKNLYYLYHAARDCNNLLPQVLCISDSLYETRIDSPKSDKRINSWYNNPDQLIKMRMAIKELIYETGQWQQKELMNPDRNIMTDNSKRFVQTLEFFTRLYFSIPLADEKVCLPEVK